MTYTAQWDYCQTPAYSSNRNNKDIIQMKMLITHKMNITYCKVKYQ